MKHTKLNKLVTLKIEFDFERF